MEDRRKQKRHRVKKAKKNSHSNFPGKERGPPSHHRNGKKGYVPESMFNHLHLGPKLREDGKKRKKRPRHDIAKMAALAQKGSSVRSGCSTASGQMGRQMAGPEQSSVHGFQQRGLMPAPLVSRRLEHPHHSSAGGSSSFPFVQYGGGNGPLDSANMGHIHPASLSSLTYHQPQSSVDVIKRQALEPEDVEVEEGEVDDLSQGYDSSERDFSLIDDPMMPANSDSSDNVED